MLKSLKLSKEELTSRKEHYIKILKSYEVLSDPKSKSNYDISLNTSSLNDSLDPEMAKHTRSNQFHYSRPTGPRYAQYKPQHTYSTTGSSNGNQDPSETANANGSTSSDFGGPSGTAYFGPDDVPHFDAKAHLRRNLQNERRVRQRKIITDGADIITHDLDTGHFRHAHNHSPFAFKFTNGGHASTAAASPSASSD
ncbi:unnamed protein product [Ambrosiozyma monospora]|uniref:Unnamed protein product n=1 Tax=Ambrosiozyma monospora TaxID=43982 RepID=A0ACB5U9I7_AMBMO|nr:unnamed protein product [Ambrosiozyma monospora]